MQPPNAYGQQAVSAQRQRTYRDPRNDPANWNRGGLSVPSYPGVGQTGTGYGQQSSPTPARMSQFNQGTMTALNPSQNQRQTTTLGTIPSSAMNAWNGTSGGGDFGSLQAMMGQNYNGGVPQVLQGRYLGSDSSATERLGSPRQATPMGNIPMGSFGQQSQMQIPGVVSGPMPPTNLGYSQSQSDPILLEQMRRKRLLQQQQMLGGQMGQMGNSIPAYQAESPYAQNVTQPFPVQNQWQQRIPQNFNQGTAYDQFTRRW